MSYQKRISRAAPGLISFVLDDSGSMQDPLVGTSDAKFMWVERYVGILLKELLSRSTEVRGDATEVKPRYFMAVIRYGNDPSIWGDPLMDVKTTIEKYAQAGNSVGLGGHLGGTDAATALEHALDQLKKVVKDPRFRESFPPMVFHLTDGMSQTDATSVTDQIKQLQTSDGGALVVNAYIGTQTSLNYKGPEDFPGYVDAAEAGPDEDNLRLFEMSSVLPDAMHANLVEDGIFPKLRPGARLFFDVRTKEMLKNTIQVVGSLGSRADRTVR